MLILKSPLLVTMQLLLLCCLYSVPSFAETYTLSGKITDTAGKAVPSATVSAKSIATGKTYTAESTSDGTYSIHDLAGGDYEVSAVAGELQAPPIKVTLAAAQSTDLVVSPGTKKVEVPPGPQRPQHTPPPASNAPSLSDLGFTPQQTQANTQLQASLVRRTEMLKIHQRLGLITLIPMAAAVITGPMAKAKGKMAKLSLSLPTPILISTPLSVASRQPSISPPRPMPSSPPAFPTIPSTAAFAGTRHSPGSTVPA